MKESNIVTDLPLANAYTASLKLQEEKNKRTIERLDVRACLLILQRRMMELERDLLINARAYEAPARIAELRDYIDKHILTILEKEME